MKANLGKNGKKERTFFFLIDYKPDVSQADVFKIKFPLYFYSSIMFSRHVCQTMGFP